MKVTLRVCVLIGSVGLGVSLPAGSSRAEGDWEITPASEKALKRGLNWLAQNQGDAGNWESDDLGLVSLGALAFLAAGHRDGIGPNGKAADRALQFVLRSARPSGLLNIAKSQSDMYNHGLSTFVLGQAHGMMNDKRISPVLDRALKLIASTQCGDGGWTYHARADRIGHDLSLAVMQAIALRSAVDSGLEVPPEVINLAIRSVREHYSPKGVSTTAPEAEQKRVAGEFTYGRGGQGPSTAMAAAGVVCLQEFGQYDDWRIPKSMDVVTTAIAKLPDPGIQSGRLPFDPYTLYYVGQAPSIRWAASAGSITIRGCATISWHRSGLTAAGSMGSTDRESPASCSPRPWPASSWRCPTVTCRSCRRVELKACGRGDEATARDTRLGIAATAPVITHLLLQWVHASRTVVRWYDKGFRFARRVIMLNFLPGYGVFALAGLVAAAAPVLIHLLNRRRFQVTEWAAMQFLRDAVRRNRRIMRLRELRPRERERPAGHTRP
jgi:hypothetical protein